MRGKTERSQELWTVPGLPVPQSERQTHRGRERGEGWGGRESERLRKGEKERVWFEGVAFVVLCQCAGLLYRRRLQLSELKRSVHAHVNPCSYKVWTIVQV